MDVWKQEKTIMKTLFIDIGSSSIKWAEDYTVDSPNGVLNVQSIPFPKAFNDVFPYFEVSIEKIINIIINIIEGAMPEKLFISAQMHGYVLTDGEGCNITQYISWQDQRARLVQYPYKISKEHGVDLKPNLPRASIYAMSKLQPDIFARAREFFTLGSYVAHTLTGRNITHISDAAPSGFYNVITDSADAYDLKLPKSVKDIEVAGEYKGIKVFTPVGDQQASILGTESEKDSYILNLGTAGQLCTVNDNFITGDYESRPYFFGRTLCTVTGLMGGKAILDYKGDDIESVLYENYMSAIKKLPYRDKLVVTGGVVKHRQKTIKEIAKKLCVNYSLNMGLDAINGLKIIAKEIYK